MPTYAACNDYRKRVTGLCLAKDPIEARQLLHMRPTDKRRVVEMPENRFGWTLATATQRIYPEHR